MTASPAEAWDTPLAKVLRPADNQAATEALLSQLVEALNHSAEGSPIEAAALARRVPPERVLLTPEEAGEGLGIGRTTVYALMKSGELESVQIGRLRRIPTSALHDYAARLVQRARNQEA
jgi:excisionase family DNA binding protein